MSAVTAEELETVLADALERKTAALAELEAAKAAYLANESLENFKRYYRAHADLGRRELRLSLLEHWAAGLVLERRAA